MIGDAAEHVGEPGLGIEPVELRRGDQAIHGGSPFAATIAAGEEPGAASEGNAAQHALSSIVRQADAAVVESRRRLAQLRAGQPVIPNLRLVRDVTSPATAV